MPNDEQVDMTPMIDVTFLLLIFFMITAAYRLQKSIEVPSPEEEAASGARTLDDYQQDSIVVRIDGDNVYWISSPTWPEAKEKEAPSVHEMLVQLRDARQSGNGANAGPPTMLLVLANGEASHERVVSALDAGTDVGMEQVRLATLDEE